MTDDLFLDLWQKQNSHTRAGPLIPSIHEIRDPRKKYYVKQEISRLWKLSSTRANNPAPQPVSIERRYLPQLARDKYAVAEKTDGVRFLLFLSRWPKLMGGQPCAIMCSRKYDMYEVRVMAFEDYFRGSLLDGELVWEYEGGQFTPPRQVFLAFDVVALKGTSYVAENYIRRYSVLSDVLDCGDKDITQDPRKWIEHAAMLAENNKIVCEGNQYCMCFRAKRIMSKEELGTVWRTRKTLLHKSDGLIFTPINDSICTGTHHTMYKWKSQHTIDVLWQCEWNRTSMHWDYQVVYYDRDRKCRGDIDGVVLPPPSELKLARVNEGGDLYPYDDVPLIIVPNDYSQQIIEWHQRRGETEFSHIVECVCKLPTMTEWITKHGIPIVECSVIKIRYDKAESNQKNTIERTLRNIRENITIKDLLDVVCHPKNSKDV